MEVGPRLSEGEWSQEQRPRFIKSLFLDLKPLMTPDERSRVGEAGGEAMAVVGVSASVATASTFSPPGALPDPDPCASQSIREVLSHHSRLISVPNGTSLESWAWGKISESAVKYQDARP